MSIRVFAGCLVALAVCCPVQGVVAQGDPEPLRVRFRLDVEGELFAPAGRDAEPVRQPIEVHARFDYLERPAADTATAAVVRDYVDAAADLVVAGDRMTSSLGRDARSVNVRLEGLTPAAFLPDGFLSRDEADLLDTPFDPLLLDAVRPAGPQEEQVTWTLPGDLAAGLLAIDTIESGAIVATLAEVVDGVATVSLAGTVEGAVDGVATRVVVEGRVSVPTAPEDDGRHRLSGRVSRVAVTLEERRQASHVAPGFDVVARVNLARQPDQAGAAGLAAAPAEAASQTAAEDVAGRVARRRGPGRPGLVWHRDPTGRFDLVHDARWRAVEDGPHGLVLRFIDRGALVAQCSITGLPRADGAGPTIAEVQRDIERSLAGQFNGVEQAAEARRSDGVRSVRVVSVGTAENLPFRWIHYVLTDAEGRRAAVTFMLEASMAERFGAADRDLVDGLAFAPETAAEQSEAQGVGPAAREARLPRKAALP
jgi:hypothetical protein